MHNSNGNVVFNVLKIKYINKNPQINKGFMQVFINIHLGETNVV